MTEQTYVLNSRPYRIPYTVPQIYTRVSIESHHGCLEPSSRCLALRSHQRLGLANMLVVCGTRQVPKSKTKTKTVHHSLVRVHGACARHGLEHQKTNKMHTRVQLNPHSVTGPRSRVYG